MICVNLSEDQIDDRIDDALQYFRDWHFDGLERTYLKHVLTAQDISNEYVTVSDEVQGVIRIFDVGESINTSSMFNVKYQISLNDLWDFTSTHFTSYYMGRRHIETLDEILVGHQPIDFNRHTDRVYVRMDWKAVSVGDYLIMEAYVTVDPDTYTSVWSDPWLKDYGDALLRMQWGMNLTKFSGVQLPGGTTLNGDKILEDAREDVKRLQEEMLLKYSLPPSDYTG